MAKKFLKNIFVPNKNNHYEPYGLRFKALTLYLIILIILQLGTVFIAEPQTTQKALAASEISSPEIVSLTNAERAARGLPTLAIDNRLNTAAYNKCVDMFTHQYWDHTSPSGITPWYFISQAGYNYVYAGENLAKGFTSSTAVVNAWMNSPSHRANILSANFQDTGVAVMTGNLSGIRTTLCVQMFGSQATYTPAPTPAVSPTPTPTVSPPPSTPSQVEQPPSPPLPAQIQPPSAPQITQPKEGEILNNNKPAISGKSAKDTKINIYEGSSQIAFTTTEPEGIFITKPTEPLKDGEHKIEAEAYYPNGPKSNRSSPLKFFIDTIPPLINESSLKADSFIKNNTENYKVAVEVKDDPTEVTASVDHYSLVLNRDLIQKDLFTGLLMPPPLVLTENPRRLTITANDKAGNQSSYLITIPKPEIAKMSPLQKIASTVKGFLPRDFQNIARLLYFILGLWIFILLLIDGVVVYTQGIVRVSSHARAHLAIVFIMLVGILFASLGRII